LNTAANKRETKDDKTTICGPSLMAALSRVDVAVGLEGELAAVAINCCPTLARRNEHVEHEKDKKDVT